MHKRTFVRIMIDGILNNPICRAVMLLVNFCNNSMFYNKKNLKFLGKMPLKKEDKQMYYKNRFIFDSSQATGVYTK